MKPKIMIVSGYLNPIHKRHLEYLIHSKAKGDLLYVILNSNPEVPICQALGFESHR